MLAYRHGFHAGNHADVLKHSVLLAALEYLQNKPGAVHVIDTHAGAALHDLDGPAAQKQREFEQGIGRLWETGGLPGLLERYRAQVRSVNPDGKLHLYPGSSRLLLRMLREQDRLHACERHPTEIEGLQDYFATHHPQVQVHGGDGFAALGALLPPPSRRGLVLIDPSYEDRADYRRVHTSLREALKRFAGGCYLVWYPVLRRREPIDMVERLRRLRPGSWLDVRLTVGGPYNLQGSGVLIINPPWTLRAQLQDARGQLVQALAQDEHAECLVEHGQG